ncbi:MAG: glycosyltransferase family 2 protein [Acidobacteriota bacterium]
MVTACAVIAAFNEAPHIAAVVAGTRRWVPDVIVVDDGSTDDTAARAREAGATVLQHAHNMGKGRAIRTGLSHVLALPCSHVLFIDGDLQHDPGEIPALIAAIERGAGDFVIGEREFVRETMPRSRYYTNIIGSRLLSGFIGADVMDSQSGFRLVRSDCLRRITLTATGYEIETEMLIKLVRAGAHLDRVSIRRLDYVGAHSKIRPFRDTSRTCLLAVKYRYLTR